MAVCGTVAVKTGEKGKRNHSEQSVNDLLNVITYILFL